MSIWSSNCKVIDLAFKKDAVAVDDSQIEARFRNSWFETKFMQRLRVSLHGREYQNNMTVGDGRASLVLDPPFVEGLVGANKEALLGGWGFGKGIRHVDAKD